MSVSIPAAYDSQDLSVSTGLASGQKINSAAIQVLANNHNFVGANFSPTVGNVFSVEGFVAPATSTNFQNFFVCPVERELDGRGLYFTGLFINSSSSDLVIRLSCGSSVGSDVTVPASTTTPTVYTVECATPTSANFVAGVQCQTGSEAGALKCFSGSFYWKGKSGSSSAPTASGYVWANTAQHASTFPFTVEHVNRFMGGPTTAWKATPQVAASMIIDAIVRPFTTSSTSYVTVGYLLFERRGWDKLRLSCIGNNGVMRILGVEVATGTNANAATTGTALLTGTFTPSYDVTHLKEGEVYVAPVEFKSVDGNVATLYSSLALVGGK
tara:strand:- start:4325 stop:5305 length:981 start_codon:yes stop_codon:yes gene_type:complete